MRSLLSPPVRSLLSPLVAAALLACARPAPPPPAPPPAPPARPEPSAEARAEAQALFAEAKELTEEKAFASARQKLERAVKLDPTHADAHVSLAESYWRSGRWDDAVREAERGRDADPTNFRAWSGLTTYYRGIALDAEAEAAARGWIEHGPPDPAPWKELADLGYDRGNYALCVEGAEGALRVVESSAAASVSDAAKLIYEDMLRSRAVCREAIRLGATAAAPPAAADEPAAATRTRRGRRQFLEGVRMTQQRRFAAAAIQFEQALAARPDDVETLLRLSDARWRGGRRDDAVKAAERARELQPTNTAALSALAVYQRELERWKESESSYRRFAELSPGDPWPWSGLGLLGYQSGNWSLCVESYERYVTETNRRKPSLFSEQTKDGLAEARAQIAKCRAKRR